MVCTCVWGDVGDTGGRGRGTGGKVRKLHTAEKGDGSGWRVLWEGRLGVGGWWEGGEGVV